MQGTGSSFSRGLRVQERGLTIDKQCANLLKQDLRLTCPKPITSSYPATQQKPC